MAHIRPCVPPASSEEAEGTFGHAHLRVTVSSGHSRSVAYRPASYFNMVHCLVVLSLNWPFDVAVFEETVLGNGPTGAKLRESRI